MPQFESINYQHPVPDVTKPFTITCPKETDVYSTPPSMHRFDAPFIFTKATVGAFKSVTVTVTGPWTYLYDQGGLILRLNFQGQDKWIKTGIELYKGTPIFSVVAKDRFADWSMRPIPDAGKQATIHIEPAKGSLWVYVVADDGTKHPVREVTWWGELDQDTELHVGPAAAKPSTEGGDLEVEFKDFKLDLV